MNSNTGEHFVSRGFKLTQEQLSFIAEGSYGFVTRSGKSYYRDLKIIAQDKKSGNAVVKETYSGDYDYEKQFILSPDGKTEKFKASHQTSPIKNNRFNFFNRFASS
jgi:hypothetical protein